MLVVAVVVPGHVDTVLAVDRRDPELAMFLAVHPRILAVGFHDVAVVSDEATVWRNPRVPIVARAVRWGQLGNGPRRWIQDEQVHQMKLLAAFEHHLLSTPARMEDD